MVVLAVVFLAAPVQWAVPAAAQARRLSAILAAVPPLRTVPAVTLGQRTRDAETQTDTGVFAMGQHSDVIYVSEH
eukprot:3899312-Amphidinium_carterae.1